MPVEQIRIILQGLTEALGMKIKGLVSTDDHYNVFAIESEHSEQSESIIDTYPIKQDEHNLIIDSLDMSNDREQIDQNDDDDDDLANERELLASLIEKLKCEIDNSKNRNKSLETSNKNQELKTVSYHKLYDILKQHQNEVNEIRAKRIACNANPLALVAQQQPLYHPQNHPTHYTQNSSTRSQQAATKNRGKVIINSPTPIYDQEPSMVAEDDEMSKDKEIDKLMALISLSFKKIYKPTNNNLRTSSNTSRANQDNSLWITRGTGYDNQRLGNVAGARETVGTMVVQKSRIQCYNCKEFGHVARECQKPKRTQDAAYHRENMLLCKQEEAGILLNAEQADWKDDTDDESDDQDLEAHYMYMAKLQKVTPDAADNFGPIFDTELVQHVQTNDNYNVFAI
nr:hypothetical protein [Tanacetum cinerariifolium]